jgi:hypothetical protein
MTGNPAIVDSFPLLNSVATAVIAAPEHVAVTVPGPTPSFTTICGAGTPAAAATLV